MNKYMSVKRHCSLLMLIILSITLLACGNKKNDEALVKVNKGQAQEEKIKVSDKIENMKLYDDMIQIQNKMIKLPATYTDFIKSGAVLTSDGITEDYLMDADSDKDIEMSAGDTVFTIKVQNNTKDRISLKKADVVQITKTQGENIFYAKGIHVGSTLDELNKKWGQPTVDLSKDSDKELQYCYYEEPVDLERFDVIVGSNNKLMSATGNEYTIIIDRNTSKIKDIQYKWVNCKDTKEIKDFSFDMNFGQNKCKLSYKVPNYLIQNKMTLGDNYMTVCNIDGEPYVITFCSQLQGFGNTDGITDEKINSVITGAYPDRKYDIDVLNKTDSEASACGYWTKDNFLQCKVVYMTKEHFYYTTVDCKITPVDPNKTLSQSAVSKFKDIMSTFASSIHES